MWSDDEDVQLPLSQKGSQLDETKRNIAELEAQLAKMEAGEDMDAEWAEHLDKLDQFNEPIGDDADDSDQITISNAGFPDANWAFRIGYMGAWSCWRQWRAVHHVLRLVVCLRSNEFGDADPRGRDPAHPPA